MARRLFLGVDQGTSSSKAMLVSMKGEVVWHAQLPVQLRVGTAGRVTQDPYELVASMQQLLDRAIEHYPDRIEAIGFSLQRSGVTAWRGQKVLHSLLSHQDSSLRDCIEAQRPWHDEITNSTGLPVLPGFAAPKIAMLQQMHPDCQVGTLDAFALHSLSGGTQCHTEHTMAARTMLYDLETHGYSEKLCARFAVEYSRLIPIRNSLDQHCDYKGIPVTAMLGDQQAALLGGMESGAHVVLNLGTIASLAASTGGTVVRAKGLVSSVLCASEHSIEHLIEAILPACGGLLMRLEKFSAGASLDQLDSWCHQACREYPTAHGFFVVEHTGSPDFMALPSTFVGSLDPKAIILAAVDHIAFSIAELVQCMKQAGVTMPAEILVTGGLSTLSYLMQSIADAANCRLLLAPSNHGTAYGVALMAAKAIGTSIPTHGVSHPQEFEPQPERSTIRYERWKALRARVYRNEVGADERFTF